MYFSRLKTSRGRHQKVLEQANPYTTRAHAQVGLFWFQLVLGYTPYFLRPSLTWIQTYKKVVNMVAEVVHRASPTCWVSVTLNLEKGWSITMSLL